MFWSKTYLTGTSAVPEALVEKEKAVELVKLGVP